MFILDNNIFFLYEPHGELLWNFKYSLRFRTEPFVVENFDSLLTDFSDMALI